jgi:hypothetical protein
MDAVADRLLAKLRQLAPHRVRVYDGSGEHRDVSVPNRRKRWSAVIEAIEAKTWVQCELLDKGGAVLGYVENDGEAKELEQLSPGGAKDRWFLEMMLKAQDTALKWRNKEHADLLTGMRDLLEVNTHATRELVEIFRVQRDVSADVAAMQAAAANGGDMDQIIKLIEASPQLMQVVGPLLQLLLQRGKAKPKLAAPGPANGAKS